MVRILQVVTHMNRGGLETMLMNYYRHIDRTQVQFDFLTHREYSGDYGEEIKALGGKIYHLPILNPFSLKYRRALHDFFVSHPEYQIVHVHQDCMSSVILKEAKKCGIPVRIAHSHSNSQDKNLKYIIKMFYKADIPKYSTQRLACSKAAGEWMFGGADFSIVRNAIDAAQYAFDTKCRKEVREVFQIDESELVIGHVGRFNYPKNHTFLIDTFAKIQEMTNAKLLLVGDGELRPQIEEKVRTLGLTDKVIFAGVRKDVEDLLQAMDVFVFPSNYEGLPVTLVEAQAAGLPCLISDRVPIECKITELVQQVQLSESSEAWAKKAVEACSLERRNTLEEIKKAGYDIEENAKWLQDYYLNEHRGTCNETVTDSFYSGV